MTHLCFKLTLKSIPMKTNTMTRKKKSQSGKTININDGSGRPGNNLTKDKLGKINAPKKFKVEPMSHFPGPFDQKTSIVYKLDQPSCVSLVVYSSDTSGMTYLVCGFQREGYHKVDFDASELPAGVYVARLRTEKGIIKEFMTKLGNNHKHKPD